MKNLFGRIKKDKMWRVTATDGTRTRTEDIDSDNEIFKGAKTPETVKMRYEGFWKSENVKVLKVKKLK